MTAAGLDAATQEHVEATRTRRPAGLAGRERWTAVALAASFLAIAVPLALTPSDRSPALGTVLLLVVAYAVASRVEFEIGAGSAVPTQLVFVPLLFVVPAGAVPLAVAGGYVLGNLGDHLRRRMPVERSLVVVGASWYAVGPAAILVACGEPEPGWHDLPLIVGLLAGQIGADLVVSTGRERLALGIHPRTLLRPLGCVYLVDVLLAPAGFLVAVATIGQPFAILSVVPLIVLLAVFARERRARIDHALELSTVRAVNNELDEQARGLAAVLRVARGLAGDGRADATGEAVCHAALEIGGATVAALFEATGGHVRLTAAAGATLPVGADFDRSADDPELHAVLAGGVGLVVSVAAGAVSPRLRPLDGCDTLVFEPVLRESRVLGVLVVGWPRAAADAHVRCAPVLRLLAAEIAATMERAALLSRLDRLARTDALTGVANRRAWEEELPTILDRARHEQTPLCVALLDLDHFKVYNDAHGHQRGDQLLRDAARLWRGELRPTDLLARYGGEEFAIVLPGCELHAAAALADRLRRVRPAGQTCSIGVAAWDGVESAQDVVRRADEALYRAKARGRDVVVVAPEVELRNAA